MINLLINDQKVSVQEGTTVLAAAKMLKINIPTLCNHDDLCVAGNCRVCIVEQKGARTLIASCATPNIGLTVPNAIKIRIANFSHWQMILPLATMYFLILLRIINIILTDLLPLLLRMTASVYAASVA